MGIPWHDEDTEELAALAVLGYESKQIGKLKKDKTIECLNGIEVDNKAIARIVNRRKKRLQEQDDPEGVEH